MVTEKLPMTEQALLRMQASPVGQLVHRQLNPSSRAKLIVIGLQASLGAATGKVARLVAAQAVVREKAVTSKENR
jgi:hypothetical protein